MCVPFPHQYHKVVIIINLILLKENLKLNKVSLVQSRHQCVPGVSEISLVLLDILYSAQSLFYAAVYTMYLLHRDHPHCQRGNIKNATHR